MSGNNLGISFHVVEYMSFFSQMFVCLLFDMCNINLEIYTNVVSGVQMVRKINSEKTFCGIHRWTQINTKCSSVTRKHMFASAAN